MASTATKKATAAKVAAKAEGDITVSAEAVKESSTDKTEKKERIVPREIDVHEYVTVRNGSRGKLIYISPRTGERYVWEEFGDEQELELQELKNAKAANKKFFERNWFMFDEEFDWVIDYLGVRQFYAHSIGIDNFDDLFKKKPDELESILNDLSDGQKRSVGYRARQLLADGLIDSMKVVDVLEKCLGTELIER